MGMVGSCKMRKTADQFYYYKKLPDGWMMYIYDVTQEKRIVLKEEQRIINGKKLLSMLHLQKTKKFSDETKTKVKLQSFDVLILVLIGIDG